MTSLIDKMLYQSQDGPTGLDVAIAGDLIWLRAEMDPGEDETAFLERATRQARRAGFTRIQVSGFLDTAEDIEKREKLEAILKFLDDPNRKGTPTNG